MTRVLAFDPGLARVGFAAIDKNNDSYSLFECGLIETKPSLSVPERLFLIHKQALELAQRFKPDFIAVEELFFSKNTKTAIDVAQARGALLIVGHHTGLKVVEFTPAQVKQAVTSYGAADKHQVGEMVKLLLGLDYVPKPDDVADACAVGLCGLFTTTCYY
ncbi:MAG TPA: crossover junction endodeoxyribonuclease RuvC [Caldisericia bacterium]|nr:crossover junction endodeoxyribonuclease RuvC [Caldisericia bacterium]HPF49490.1 crossover junction endodeoxyribonuclease RuvC [Caldisericia bacterium]HPI84216.1 crossover junction endodeoxyribonuclease RuvC [Caldisericia bacterium]HPQ93489.1 crossover junction endodeoxyribonuclease RuvC [Caldisericia bacterium]HRV75505.1 crossover junction endodeoxyribonuclease RuvC [Caldisericia bacterium]